MPSEASSSRSKETGRQKIARQIKTCENVLSELYQHRRQLEAEYQRYIAAKNGLTLPPGAFNYDEESNGLFLDAAPGDVKVMASLSTADSDAAAASGQSSFQLNPMEILNQIANCTNSQPIKLEDLDLSLVSNIKREFEDEEEEEQDDDDYEDGIMSEKEFEDQMQKLFFQ